MTSFAMGFLIGFIISRKIILIENKQMKFQKTYEIEN
jgi:hypothetical protein